MNLQKLNEKLSKLLEISDETKKSYLDKRQAQADKAQKNLEKAKKSVAKSDERQISNLPQRTSLENAEKALNTLKSEMKKVSNGSDWRLEEDEDGEYLNLSVRYWGQWNDRDEDDDWAPLDDKYKQILDDILVKVQKQHGVQIINQGSEKKWLSFDVLLDDSVIDKEAYEPLDFSQWEFDVIYDSLSSSSRYWTIVINSITKDFEHLEVRIYDIFDNVIERKIFDHFPSIEEIKKFASACYPNIVDCRIPQVPNKLKREFINDNVLELRA